MKKQLITYLFAVAAFACGKESVQNAEDNTGEIKLNTGLSAGGASVKSVLNAGNAFSPTIWAATNTATGFNSGQTYFENNASVAASTPPAPGAVTFGAGATYYYPVNGSTIYFWGFHPSVAAGMARNGASAIKYTGISGDQDIMVSNTVSGTRYVAPDPLIFQHKLTQLQFRVKGADSFPAGKKLTGITVADVTPDFNYTYGGTASFSGTPADLAIQLNTAVTTVTNISTTAIEAGYIMVPPATTYSFIVAVDGLEYAAVAVAPTDGEGYKEGHSHIITLTIAGLDVEITGTATVTAWEDDDYGEVIIDPNP